jgi:type I restriction enzyme M protein
VFDDHNLFREKFDAAMKAHGQKPGAADKKTIFKTVSWRDEAAPPVVVKRQKLKTSDAFEPGFDGRTLEGEGKSREVIWYEPDTDLRDTEQVPLKEPGGIEAFFRREVLPHASDAWVDSEKTQIGYEISFARYFYKPAPLRSLAEIRADILKLEQQTEGLLDKIVGGVPA